MMKSLNQIPFLLCSMAAASLAQVSPPQGKPAGGAAGGDTASSAQQAPFDLGTKWTIIEKGDGTTYTGTWTMRDDGKTFDASWFFPDGKAVLTRDRTTGKQTKVSEITVESVNGNQIVLFRRAVNGRYIGTIAADGVHITGTRSWNEGNWIATIERGKTSSVTPSPAPTTPIQVGLPNRGEDPP